MEQVTVTVVEIVANQSNSVFTNTFDQRSVSLLFTIFLPPVFEPVNVQIVVLALWTFSTIDF